jgi:MATE family, multidrug efflux pump
MSSPLSAKSFFGTNHSPQWLRARLKRHFSELARLALPAVMMRIGLMAIAMVDTAMVGHYATQHLAWLNLANQSLIMFALVVGLGLLSGILFYTSNAFGTDDFREAGRIWRRNIPFTLGVGAGVLLVMLPSEYWLTLLGQSAEDAKTSGWIAVILALGLPGHFLFVNCTMFLEGIKRAEVGFYMMVAANLINVALNYALIFGNWGLPELGAEGSAWASTGVRWFMAASALTFVWWAPSLRKYQVRRPHGQAYKDWADQRQMGYASAVSLAAEVGAFGALAIFAGWLGTVPLAAHGVIFQVVGLPLMMSIGIGVATTVRVGIAFARKDRADTALAALSGIALNFMLVGALGIVIYFYSTQMIHIFTKDDRIIALLIPLASLFIISMLFDASQMVASLVLRGFKETWWPTYLQSFSFMVVMLPACYYLAFPFGMGLEGLVIGMLIGVIVAWTLQILRIVWLIRRPLSG